MGPRSGLGAMEKIRVSGTSWESNPSLPSPSLSYHVSHSQIVVITIYST
jgi:hypothetical protein